MVQLPILFQGSFGETVLDASFDEDLSFSLVCEAYLQGFAESVRKPNTMRAFHGTTDFTIESNKAVCLDFMLNGLLLSDEFLVVENLSKPVIFGATTLRKWRIKLDFENYALIVNPNIAKFKLI